MSTPIILVDELVEFIKPVVKNFSLQANHKEIRKAPQVLVGYLDEKKPKDQQEVPDFPYVIVRYLDDNDTDEADTATVRIYAGTYSEDVKDGWRDAMNVITRIKQALLKKPNFSEAYAFSVERPIRTEQPEEQPFPEWIAIMTINVTMPQIQEEGGYY